MSDKSIDKKILIQRISKHLKKDTGTAEEIVDAALEEIYEALKQGESVSLRGFGTFYIDPRPSGTAFKFNPSQRLRALFGWSSTYKGEP
jgi:DNA-binding protein HU-beta